MRQASESVHTLINYPSDILPLLVPPLASAEHFVVEKVQ